MVTLKTNSSNVHFVSTNAKFFAKNTILGMDRPLKWSNSQIDTSGEGSTLRSKSIQIETVLQETWIGIIVGVIMLLN